ncbi:MAG TPA: hypothetical protein PKX78_01035 [Candidatus Woesebacteria bacterium]|nr:hypothetical protein [Candidatus Woesebacteria bacterium]
MNEHLNHHLKKVVATLSTVYADNSPEFTDNLVQYLSFLSRFQFVDHVDQNPLPETNSECQSNQLVALIDSVIKIFSGTAEAPDSEDQSSLITENQVVKAQIVLDIFNKFDHKNERVSWENLTPFQKKQIIVLAYQFTIYELTDLALLGFELWLIVFHCYSIFMQDLANQDNPQLQQEQEGKFQKYKTKIYDKVFPILKERFEVLSEDGGDSSLRAYMVSKFWYDQMSLELKIIETPEELAFLKRIVTEVFMVPEIMQEKIGFVLDGKVVKDFYLKLLDHKIQFEVNYSH